MNVPTRTITESHQERGETVALASMLLVFFISLATMFGFGLLLIVGYSTLMVPPGRNRWDWSVQVLNNLLGGYGVIATSTVLYLALLGVIGCIQQLAIVIRRRRRRSDAWPFIVSALATLTIVAAAYALAWSTSVGH